MQPDVKNSDSLLTRALSAACRRRRLILLLNDSLLIMAAIRSVPLTSPDANNNGLLTMAVIGGKPGYRRCALVGV